MSRRLLILRHAKSDWADPGVSDFDRPLNARGRADVPRITQFLAGSAEPELVLSSSARRANETAQGLIDGLATSPELRLEQDLYLAPPETLAAMLGTVSDRLTTVVLVAHNPGIEDWASQLSGASIHLPPGGLACLDCPQDTWAAAGCDGGSLLWLLTPKLLKRGLDQA